MLTFFIINSTQEVDMRTLTCTLLALGLAGFAYAANSPDQLKEIQEYSDDFLQAAVDDDFDAFLELASSTRKAEYEKNEINCPLARWWESAREAVDEEGASWEFVKVQGNTDDKVTFVYKKTDKDGEKDVSVHTRKEGDEWFVDAAGGAF
jgi:hypothetical protein